MKCSGWGNYKKVFSHIIEFLDKPTLKHKIKLFDDIIPYGNGRSYGDSALSKNIIKIRKNNLFLDFDEAKGVLNVQSGALLSEILYTIIPRGWFLKITPGTKLITIGGAIASDVHGKNHHIEGCFSECVKKFSLMLPNGEIIECGRDVNSELFMATCGGMGLTGIILNATIKLEKIESSNLNQITIKTKNLHETFEAFEKYKNYSYSVAWIDCLAKKNSLGRCLLSLGEFSDDGELNFELKNKITIPFYFPSFILNSLSVKLLNSFHYRNSGKTISNKKVDIDSFFYPLDKINYWNRIYGKNGFIQYQFVLPKKNSGTGMREILELISASGRGSFLAVLKLHGKGNENYLSFPMEGYSLALDFKIEEGLFGLLDKLDALVLEHSGRIYLAKDSRIKKEIFEKGYPKIEKFRALRKKYGMQEKFNSLQSKRIGI